MPDLISTQSLAVRPSEAQLHNIRIWLIGRIGLPPQGARYGIQEAHLTDQDHSCSLILRYDASDLTARAYVRSALRALAAGPFNR